MGDFSVTCGLTGLSIWGERAIMLPLVPSEYSKYSKLEGTTLVSNNGACVFFAPAYFPVRGENDTYGRLENIDPDVEKDFQRVFKTSVNDYIESKNGMWVLEKAWDSILKAYRRDMNAWSETHLSDAVLKKYLGFKRTNKDPKEYDITFEDGKTKVKKIELPGTPEEQRYNHRLESPRYPGIVLWTDGTWLRWIERDGVKQGNLYVYCMKALAAYIDIPENTVKLLKKTSAAFSSMLVAREKYKTEYLHMLKLEADSKAEIKKRGEKITRKHKALTASCNAFRLEDVLRPTAMTQLIMNVGPENVFKTERMMHMVAEVQDVMWILYLCNRYFAPTMHGPQYPDESDEMYLKVNEFSTRYILGRKRDTVV